MFREEISRIDVPLAIAKFYWRFLHSQLDPESSCVYVAKLAEPAPATDANGGGGVCPYCEGNVLAKICQGGLVAEADTKGLDNSVELSFATTVADDSLSRAPGFDEVRSKHEAPSIRRFTGFGTPRPTRTAVCVHLPCRLPCVLEAKAWAPF